MESAREHFTEGLVAQTTARVSGTPLREAFLHEQDSPLPGRNDTAGQGALWHWSQLSPGESPGLSARHCAQTLPCHNPVYPVLCLREAREPCPEPALVTPSI